MFHFQRVWSKCYSYNDSMSDYISVDPRHDDSNVDVVDFIHNLYDM